MKNQKKNAGKPLTWYERIWNKIELVNTNPKLDPYLDVDKFSDYQANLVAKLIGQSLPSASVKALKHMTPEKLGIVLGTQCGSAYKIGEQCQQLFEQAKVGQAEKAGRGLIRQQDLPEASSQLHSLQVSGMLVQQFAEHLPLFEKNVHAAFRSALKQTSHQEAVEFFRGFARGISKPGYKDGRLAGETSATPLETKMFMHTEAVAKMKSVKELRAFLLKNGFTEETLGDDERLQKFCTRLGYAPGKKQPRPSRQKKP